MSKNKYIVTKKEYENSRNKKNDFRHVGTKSDYEAYYANRRNQEAWDQYVQQEQQQTRRTAPTYYYDSPYRNRNSSGSSTGGGGGGARNSRALQGRMTASAGVSDMPAQNRNRDISRQEKSKWINKTISELEKQYKTALDESLTISPYNTQQKLAAQRKAEDLRKRIDENKKLLEENNGTKENVTAPTKESGKPGLYREEEKQKDYRTEYDRINGEGTYQYDTTTPTKMAGPKQGTKIEPQAAKEINQGTSLYDNNRWINRTISELQKEYDAAMQQSMAIDKYKNPQGAQEAQRKADSLRNRIEENKQLLQQNNDAIAKYEEDWSKGNIDLKNRPVVKNADGTVSTVRSITVGYDDGYYVLPTVIDGKIVSNKEAEEHFEQTGEYLGRFKTQEEADYYAEKLHNKEAIRTGGTLQLGGEEEEMTPYEIYESTDPKLRGEKAAEVTNYKYYQNWLKDHPNATKEEKEKAKAAWEAIYETETEWIEEQERIGANYVPEWNQDEIPQEYTNLISDIPLFANNPERNEETDRMLYNYMSGEYGIFDWYENDKNSPDFKEKMDKLWEPLQSGELAAIAKEKQEHEAFIKEWPYQSAMNREAKRQMKLIDHQEKLIDKYGALIDQYDDNITMPDLIPEYDKGYTDGKAIRSEIEFNNGVADVDRIASFIGRGKEFNAYVEEYGKDGDFKVSSDYMYAMMMNEEEIRDFMNSYNNAVKEGRYPSEAMSFLEGLQWALRDRYSDAEKINFSEFARNHPIGAAMLSLAGRQANTYVDFIRRVADILGDPNVEDVNSVWYAFSRFSDQIEGTLANDIGGFGAKIFTNVMNAASNMLRALSMRGLGATGKWGQTALSLGGMWFQVDEEQTKRNLEKDIDYDTASNWAAVDATFEILQEFLPMEAMLGSEGLSIWKALRNNIISEMVQEGSGATWFKPFEWLLKGENESQARADEIIAQKGYEDSNGEWKDLSDLSDDHEALVEAAKLRADHEFWMEAVENTLAGGFGGGLSATYGSIVNVANLTKTGKSIKNDQNIADGMTGVQRLVGAAAGLEGTESQQQAENINAKIEKGKEPSNYEIGKLAATMAQESTAKVADVVKETVQRRILGQLNAMGITRGAKDIADAMVRSLTGEKMTSEDRTTIAKEDGALELWKSYMTPLSENYMAVRQEVDKATEPVRSVANLIGDLTGKYARATGTISAEIDQVNREAKTVDEAVDMLTERNDNLISPEYAETMKQEASAEENKNSQKTFLNDAVQIRMAAFSLNRTMPKTNLGQESAKRLWTAARNEFLEKDAQRIKNQAPIVPGKGNVSYEGEAYNSDGWKQKLKGLKGPVRTQVQAIAYIANRLGHTVNFVYDDSKITKNGKVVGDSRFVHGYESGNGAITVNVAGMLLSGARKNMMVTIAHEMTHWLEQNSAEGYAALRQFVLDNLRGKGMNVEQRMIDLISNQNSVLKGTGEKLDLNGAMAEIVAQSCEELMSSQALINQLEKENPGLHAKIKSFLRNLISKLTGGMDDSLSEEARLLRDIKEDIGKMWFAARDEALNRKEGGAEAGENVSFSVEKIDGKNRERYNNINENVKGVATNERQRLGDLGGQIKEAYRRHPRWSLTGKAALSIIRGDYAGIIAPGRSGYEYFRKALKGTVLTKNGKPIIWYHGSDRSFTQFARQKKTNYENTSGYYFSENPKVASFYAKNRRNRNLYPVAVYSKNNIVFKASDFKNNYKSQNDALQIIDDLHEYATKRGTNENFYKIMNQSLKGAVSRKKISKEVAGKIADTFTQKGDIDSVTVKDATWDNGIRNDQLIVFDSSRIIPATTEFWEGIARRTTQESGKKNYSVASMDQEYADAVEREDWRTAEDMLLQKMQQTEGITGYRAPYFYAGEHKDIARLIKSGDKGIIDSIVDDMAHHVPDNAVLVPMPPHEGKVTDKTDTMILAKALSEATGAPVINALESDYHESRYKAKAAGNRNVNAQTMGFRQIAEIPDGMMPVFIDNMVGGGQTAMAAKNAIGRGITLAYAQSSRAKSQGVKSVSVTYDQDGKLIPLSQRMDPTNKSWKYSVAQMDQDYMEAVKNGDMETAQRMADQAAEEAGYTLRGIHRTNADFTVFDKTMRSGKNGKTLGDGFYVSSGRSEYDSETYGKKRMQVYVKLGKVFNLTEGITKRQASKIYEKYFAPFHEDKYNTYKPHVLEKLQSPLRMMDYIIEAAETNNTTTDEIFKWLGYDSIKDGPQYAVFDSEQIKSADPVTYYDDGVTPVPLSERFNDQEQDIRFSLAQPVEVRKDGLIAVHNLTEQNMLDTLAEGGFTAPSVAVIRAKMGHSKYGTVSVVLYPNAIDPRKSVKNKIYGMDAWTPTRGNAQIETKLDYRVLQKARDIIENMTSEGIAKKFQNTAMNWINQWLYEDKTSDTLEDMIDRAYRNDGMIIAFEKAQGREIEEKTSFEKNHQDLRGEEIKDYNEFLDKLDEEGMLQEFMEDMENLSGNEIIEKYVDLFRESGETGKKVAEAYDNNPDGLSKRVMFAKMKKARWYQQDGRQILTHQVFDEEGTADAIRDKIDKKEFSGWISELVGNAFGKKGVYNGADPYTSSGSRKSFEATHMEPTAENIVKAMYRNHEAKGGEAGGATGLMAKASKEYRSLKEVRNDSGRLQMLGEDEYRAMVSELDNKIREFVQDVSGTTGIDYNLIRSVLIEAGGEYAKTNSAATIKRYMEKQGVKLTTEQLTTAEKLMKEAQEIPTGYFEAKPERVVGFDEIYKVIIPNNASQQLKDGLDKNGIAWETYDGTDEDRMRALNEQEDVQFSVVQPDMEVSMFMLGLNENSLSTSQEKIMLRQFKEIRKTMEVAQMALRERNAQLKKLEEKANPTAYDREEMRKIRNQITNWQNKLDRSEAQLARITNGQGYAKLMQQQEKVMRNLVSGRTYNEVRRTIEVLTAQIAQADKEIEDREKKISQMRADLRYRKAATLVDQKATEKLAAMLRKEYQSSADKQELIHMITEIRLKMAAGQNVKEDISELAWKIAAGTATDGGEQLRSLRGTTIILGAGQVKELLGKNSSMKELRDIFAGTGIKVKAAKDGEVGLDKDWSQLCDAVPSLNRDAKELEQVDELIKFVNDQKAQTDSTKMYQGHMEEFEEDLAAMIATVGRQATQDAETTRTVRQMMDLIDRMSEGIEASRQEMQKAREQMSALIEQGKMAMSQQDAMQYDIEQAIKYNNALTEQSEAELWKAERSKLIDQLKSETTEKLIAEQQKWKERIAKDKTARDMMQSNMQLRKSIHANVTRIWKLLANETDQKNIPEHMKGLAREMIGMIVDNDLYKRKISGIAKNDIVEMSRVLEIMKQQDGAFDEDDLRLITDEEAQDVVLEALADIEDGIKFYNASSNGSIITTLQGLHNALDRISEAVSTITNVIRAEQSINIGDRKIAVADAAEEIAYDMQNSKFKGERTGRGSREKDFAENAVYYGNTTPVFFFKNLKNRGMMQQWEEMKRGQNRNGLEVQKAQNFIHGLAERTKFDKWSEDKHTVKIGSRDVEMTVGQMMELYAIWKREMLNMTNNPQASSHLRKGGIILQEERKTTGKPGREKVDTRPMRVRDEDVGVMYDQLTDEQKEYLDKVVKYLSNDMSELGNEASMKMYGIKKYKESWYFPMKVWDGVKSARSDSGISGTTDNRAANRSWSKRRINKASNALIIGDFTKDAVTHIVEMINYNTMAPAIENFNKILNYQRTEADDNGDDIQGVKRNIRAMFGEAYGKNALNYLTTFLQDLNGGLVQDQRTTLRDQMISVFRKNAVAGSLSVALQQPLSYIRAAMMISPKYLARAISPEYWKGSHEEMTKYSGVAVIKDMGRFDMNFGASAKEYIAPEQKTTYEKISDKLTILPELMDRMTWTRMWSAVKIEQHELHPEMDIHSEEFLKLVGERFNDVMMQTQVYDSVMVKSQNMRSNKATVKMLTSFMSEPTLSLNILVDAAKNVKEKGGKKVLGYAVGTYALGAVLQAFFKGLMGSGRSPDDKKTWLENFLNKWGQNFISEINPLGLIPGFSDLIELAKNGELKDDAMGALGKVVTAFNIARDTVSGKKEFGYRTIEDTAAQIAQLFTNIPYKNIMRDLRAMYNYISQEPYAKRPTSGAVLRKQAEANIFTADNILGTLNSFLGDAGFVTSNKAYYGRMFDAMQSGNQAEADDIKEYLSLAKGQDDKEIQSGLKTAAKGKLKTVEADEWMINNDMMDDAGTLTTQYNEGEISKDEYKRLLKKQNPKLTDNDIWWKIDLADYKKETGNKNASGKGYRLQDAINANNAEQIRKAIKDMTAHGITNEKIKNEYLSKWKSEYLNGSSDKRRKIRDALEKAYKLIGYTAADADKTIAKWEKDAKKKKK